MYFEDIFIKIEPLWQRSFSLDGIQETETYVIDIMNDYNRIEYEVEYAQKDQYSEWERMLAYTMYQTLTAYAIEKWKNDGALKFAINEIPITLFEEKYKRNLEPEDEYEGNKEYLKQYQGFRNPPFGTK